MQHIYRRISKTTQTEKWSNNTTDKGVGVVILNKKDYEEKMEKLLKVENK